MSLPFTLSFRALYRPFVHVINTSSTYSLLQKERRISINIRSSLIPGRTQRCRGPLQGNDFVTGKWAPVVFMLIYTVVLFLEIMSSSPPPPHIVHSPPVRPAAVLGRCVSHHQLFPSFISITLPSGV